MGQVRNLIHLKHFSPYHLNTISYLLEFISLTICYYSLMKNLRENNIKTAIWHIKRHCDIIQKNSQSDISSTELYFLQASGDCLKRVINNEKP